MADEIAERHRAAARRQRRLGGISGVIMLLLGEAIIAIALRPEAPDPSLSEPRPSPPLAPALIGLAGEAIDQDACAGPALRELTKHPNWSFTFAERESTDVIGPDPDETLQTVVIDAHGGTWRDGDLPQSLELDLTERTDLLAAAERPCRKLGRGNGFTAHYVMLAYGATASGSANPGADDRVNRDAIWLPAESRAAIDTIAVMDRVRARYVAARIGIAEALTLTLHGPRRRLGTNSWAPYTMTFRPDGRIVDNHGEEIDSRFEPADHVDLLDWAMQLPASASGARPLTGTLEIAGTRRPVALQLDTMVHKIEGSGGWRQAIDQWWADNRVPRD